MKELIVKQNITLKTALKFLNKSGRKCLVIVNKYNKLIGTLSDGDIRKAITSGKKLNSTINNIFQKNPIFLFSGSYTISHAKKLFIKNKFDIIPIINTNHKLVEILHWEKIFENNKKTIKEKNNISVVIMAGGKGERLEPFTEILPKALIPVMGKTIIERIIEKFYQNGFRDFNFIVNYKSLILKAYIQEIKSKYKVKFFAEHKSLGTIGGLSLIKDKLSSNFFVSNCDVIINADYIDLLNYHLDRCNDITLVVTTKEYVIPYGDCKINKDGNLDKLIERPKFDFLINAGLYVFNKKIIKLIKKNKHLDFNELIEISKKKNYKIGVYPIHEEAWIDIGQWSEYKKSLDKI